MCFIINRIEIAKNEEKAMTIYSVLLKEASKLTARSRLNLSNPIHPATFFGRAYSAYNLHRYSLLDSGKLVQANFTKVSDVEKATFKNENCLATLSIGQAAHTGQNLAATLELINKSFASCTFVLGDTLQRHTIRLKVGFNESDNAIREKMKHEGDEWLCKNIHLLSELEIPWKIMRWDYFLHDRDYNHLANKIEQAYVDDTEYRQIFHHNVDQYLDRLKQRSELVIPEDKARELCLLYLKEECAIMCMWNREGAGHELYASGRAPAMQATYEKFIKTLNPGLLRPLALRFKKKQSDVVEQAHNKAQQIHNIDKQKEELISDISMGYCRI